MVKGAWVTLATNDSYSLGALVLAHSLKQVGTQMELAILVTPGVTNSMRARLSEVFNSVKEVNILDSKDKANLKLLQRPELGITFTKLHCWQLTEYEKCVFLDADTLVLQNCDELFEREELSAAPDVGWPDCFNSGVFVFRPSEETYNNLIQFALDKGSFDGGDQGLLNMFFSDWASKDISKHLPFIYNVCSTAFYSYLPAFKQFGKDVKIIHFIGNAKPWLQYFDTESRRVRPSRDLGHLEPILQAWWNIFCSMIHPNLTPDMISSYPSESVSARSPLHCPQQSYEPSPNDCTNYIQSVWDPWEVFDRKQLNVPVHSPKPLESHNTIALSPVATDCSHPVPEERFVGRNDQRSIDSDNFKPNDHRCIEFSDFNPKEKTLVEHSVYVTQASISRSNSETVQESSTTSPVPIHHQESSASAIPSLFKDSIPQNNPSHFALSLPEAIPQEFRQTIPEDPLPVSQSPSKFETEEESKNVPCEVDCNEQESGLAGAFAKLTLGQQRSPEQEALENSLRRQNWEQGNIDYLGRDSFDNIWSKICETLAKGPEENEGDNSAQIANDGLVQPSPEQGSPLQEDAVLSPSQEVPKPADSSKEIATQEKSPSDSIPPLTSADSPSTVPSEQITSVPQQLATSESLPAVTEQTTPKETISSVEKVPETTSVIASEEVPLQKTPAVETSPKVIDQIPSEKPSAQVTVPDTAEDASKSSETKASVEETVKSNIEQILSESKSSVEETPKSVSVSDEKIQPPTKEALESSLPEATLPQKESLVESPKVVTSEPVLEPPSTPKPEAPKQDIPPATVLITPQTPSTPTEQVLPLTEPVPPLTEQIAICPAKSISPVEETTSLKETTVGPAVLVPTPAPQTIPSTEQSPVLETSCPLVKPSAPVQSPEQEQVSSEKSLPSTIGQSAPVTPPELPKQAPTGATLAEIPQQKATAPEPTPSQTAAVTQTPTSASDETPPPPITAPPRKNGGKKNQGKSKK